MKGRKFFIINFIRKVILKPLFFCFFLFQNYSKAQNLSFTVQSTTINAEYSTEIDLESTRLLSNAITFNIVSPRSGILMYARLKPLSNQPLSTLPQNPFSIKVNTSSANLGGNAFQARPLGFSDVLLFDTNQRASRGIRVTNDLLLNPIGYSVEPGEYNFSILFTLSEK